nr:hypothetical protein BaRGS_029099 [Batillaria attramentaria]
MSRLSRHPAAVIQKVKEADFEFSDYQFSAMLPVSTILRQHAVFVHLLEKYESIYTGKEDGIPSIKDVWKWTAGPPFSELLGVPFQMRIRCLPKHIPKKEGQKGRYQKYSRVLSQTPWVVDGVTKMEGEDIGNLKEGEIDKSKTYTALCWCQRPFTHDDLVMIENTKAVDVDWPPMTDPVPEEERQRLKERESNKTVKQAGHKDDNGSDRVNPTRQSSKLVTRMTTGQTV